MVFQVVSYVYCMFPALAAKPLLPSFQWAAMSPFVYCGQGLVPVFVLLVGQSSVELHWSTRGEDPQLLGLRQAVLEGMDMQKCTGAGILLAS